MGHSEVNPSWHAHYLNFSMDLKGLSLQNCNLDHVGHCPESHSGTSDTSSPLTFPRCLVKSALKIPCLKEIGIIFTLFPPPQGHKDKPKYDFTLRLPGEQMSLLGLFTEYG